MKKIDKLQAARTSIGVTKLLKGVSFLQSVRFDSVIYSAFLTDIEREALALTLAKVVRRADISNHVEVIEMQFLELSSPNIYEALKALALDKEGYIQYFDTDRQDNIHADTCEIICMRDYEISLISRRDVADNDAAYTVMTLRHYI
jgi:hypothetical protein